MNSLYVLDRPIKAERKRLSSCLLNFIDVFNTQQGSCMSVATPLPRLHDEFGRAALELLQKRSAQRVLTNKINKTLYYVIF